MGLDAGSLWSRGLGWTLAGLCGAGSGSVAACAPVPARGDLCLLRLTRAVRVVRVDGWMDGEDGDGMDGWMIANGIRERGGALGAGTPTCSPAPPQTATPRDGAQADQVSAQARSWTRRQRGASVHCALPHGRSGGHPREEPCRRPGHPEVH
eukprot:gene15221-biopygen3217